jgi:RecJ-like exonuclease
MIEAINKAISKIHDLSRTKPIKVISHFDSDGITSAAIFSKALQRWNKKFSLQIVKNLEESIIASLPEDHILIFLDLASNSLDYLKNKKTEVFIFDHHEISQTIPENVTLINPLLYKHEMLSGAGVCYLFAKTLNEKNKDLASLAVIGMIGDSMEKDINKSFNEIIKDSEATIKKGLLIYPSTRPLDRALEYSSSPYIPGVTGSYKGVIDLLRDSNIQRGPGGFKSLHELTEEEMSHLITSIMLRVKNQDALHEVIGSLYLIKFFNRLEDARELSALINACSRMDQPHVSLGFCLGNAAYKQQAEKIYIEYKHHLVSALRYMEGSEKIKGESYTIINARDNIKDTIIGTVASILSYSPTYEKGTIIVALAYNQDKIKVSARLAGKQGKNVREVLSQAMINIGGEVGGHPNAAGCLISKEKEEFFIEELKKVLEIESPKNIPTTNV